MNAVMLAAASNNTVAFEYFYARVDSLDFDWNCRNRGGRNLPDLTCRHGFQPQIRLRVHDLLSRHIIDSEPPRTAHRRTRTGATRPLLPPVPPFQRGHDDVAASPNAASSGGSPVEPTANPWLREDGDSSVEEVD